MLLLLLLWSLWYDYDCHGIITTTNNAHQSIPLWVRLWLYPQYIIPSPQYETPLKWSQICVIPLLNDGFWEVFNIRGMGLLLTRADQRIGLEKVCRKPVFFLSSFHKNGGFLLLYTSTNSEITNLEKLRQGIVPPTHIPSFQRRHSEVVLICPESSSLFSL